MISMGQSALPFLYTKGQKYYDLFYFGGWAPLSAMALLSAMAPLFISKMAD